MRRVYGGLAAALIAFAFYGSLLPFRLRFQPIGGAWSSFISILTRPAPEYFSRTNFLANLLLFVPVGFALMGARLADRRARPMAIVLTVVPALLLSVCVSTLAEFSQVFAPGRIPALSDIIAQTIGFAVGIVTWFAAGARLTDWLRQSADRHRHDPLARLLAAYGVLWLFVALAPFDITVDLGALARRVRAGMIVLVPFGSHEPIGRQIWDAMATTLTSIPIGMLALVGGRPAGTRRRAGVAWALGAAAVATLEAAQIFVRSHAADVTTVIFGCIGVAIGVAAGARVFGRSTAAHTGSVGRSPRAALALTCMWALVVCGYHWQPFDFAIDQPLIRDKLQHLSLVPFAGYQKGSELNAFANVISKIAVAVPLGACVAYAFASPGLPPLVISMLWVAVSAVFFGGVEFGQLFVPSRVPDLTDVLVGIVSSLAGLHLARWIRERSSTRG